MERKDSKKKQRTQSLKKPKKSIADGTSTPNSVNKSGEHTVLFF
jgi:hypothetical protein